MRTCYRCGHRIPFGQGRCPGCRARLTPLDALRLWRYVRLVSQSLRRWV